MRANKKISLTVLATMSLPVMASAAANSGNSDSNILLISLVSLMLILLLAIGVLANTMRMLGIVVRDKNRAEKKSASNAAKAVLMILALSLPAIHGFAADLGRPAGSEMINGMQAGDFYLLISVIVLEIMVIFAMALQIRSLLKVISGKPEVAAAGAKAAPKESWFWDKFNAAVPVEKEKDLLMDHDYDGIRELDNSLPPWWKYGFYLTIVVAVIYLYRYHVSHDGLSSHEEYVAAMQQADEEKAEYLKNSTNNVDETNVKMLTDAADIAAGKEIFVATCAPCHLADGGGVVGPNLTDDYWLHGGSIKDIFKSIKYGWQDKGMKSWKDDFSPKQIQQLASFVKSLHGTKPATPKAPQGELYIEAGAGPAAADSTRAPADTTKK